MTETDATRRPLNMPAKFIPYLDKHRLYRLFKDVVADLIITLPRDHLKQMKIHFSFISHTTTDTYRIMLLVSPDLDIDLEMSENTSTQVQLGNKEFAESEGATIMPMVTPYTRKTLVPSVTTANSLLPSYVTKVVKELIKDLGFFVITRRSILDKYEKDDDYVPGCVDPVLMSLVTKKLTLKQPVIAAGWLMFDHPCTLREARCLQQDGVLPTTTLLLTPPPPQAPSAENAATPPRSFFEQDIEGLKYAYKATLKEVHIEADDNLDAISVKCFNAIHASAGGAQGTGHGHNAVGSPGVYRVLLIGPRGSGRKTQARMLAKHFGLVYLDYERMFLEAKEKNDDIGKKLRNYGPSVQVKTEIVRRRLMEKDCIDHGWVLTGYPSTGVEFENIDNMTTPPNRVIILNADFETCKQRALSVGYDWCTGKRAPIGSNPRVIPHPGETASQIDAKLDYYLTEGMAELRAAAGITATEIDAKDSTEDIQVKIQAAVMLAPAFDILPCNPIRNVHGE